MGQPETSETRPPDAGDGDFAGPGRLGISVCEVDARADTHPAGADLRDLHDADCCAVDDSGLLASLFPR